MTTEEQCLAMAKDQGDDLTYKNLQTGKPWNVEQYNSLEAVVNAIRRKGVKDKDFQYHFSWILRHIQFGKDIFPTFTHATSSVEELREAYLRASGLWVEESTSEEYSEEQLNKYVADALEEATKKRAITVEKIIANAIKSTGDKLSPTQEEVKEDHIPNITSEDLISHDIKIYIDKEIKKALGSVPTAQPFHAEEVVLPTRDEISKRHSLGQEYSKLDYFVNAYEPMGDAQIRDAWRIRLKYVLEEVRRGK